MGVNEIVSRLTVLLINLPHDETVEEDSRFFKYPSLSPKERAKLGNEAIERDIRLNSWIVRPF